MVQTREVTRFTFQNKDYMTARRELLPYRSEIGTFGRFAFLWVGGVVEGP